MDPSRFQAPSTDDQTLDAVSSAPENSVEPWSARLVIALPEGTVRHPALISSVERAIGRFSLVDVAYSGIRVVYGLDGPSREQATIQSDLIMQHVLGTLGLANDAVVEHCVIPLEGTTTQPPRPDHLRVVQ